MNTAELPKLKETPSPQADSEARRQRHQALTSAAALGQWHHYQHYDMVTGTAWAWIAQDDWLPRPGEFDSLAAEWPQVVAKARQHGFVNFNKQPTYDPVTGTWMWTIPRS